MNNMKDDHMKTSFVLKNGENALEFTNRKSMQAYYKRFLTLFPDVDSSNIRMFKVVVYALKSN